MVTRPSDAARSDEIAETLAELIASFGSDAVAAAASSAGLYAPTAPDAHQQTIRRLVLILIGSRRPKAVAQIVGRLCYLDTACGHDLRQEDIARENGISKQAVCNMEADIAAQLNLPRRSSPQARAAHARMNLRNSSFVSLPHVHVLARKKLSA